MLSFKKYFLHQIVKQSSFPVPYNPKPQQALSNYATTKQVFPSLAIVILPSA